MRSKVGLLCGFFLLLSGMMSTAWGNDSGEYIWTASLNNTFFVDFDNSKSASYSLYIVDSTASDIANSIKLSTIGAILKDSTIAVFKDEDSSTGNMMIKLKVGDFDTLTLGNSLNFKFVFVDSGDNIISSYMLTNSNTVTYDTQSFTVTGAGIASVSAVPIPGSALLLGSSLLGLVGISSRKKRA